MVFAAVVTFTIKAGRMEDFMPQMLDNARVSLLDEDACIQFDVATDDATPQEVFLYELYEDEAGFNAHLQSGHFLAFSLATSDMIAKKTVRTFSKVVQ